MPAEGQGVGGELSQVHQHLRRGLGQRLDVDRPVQVGADVGVDAAGQALELGAVEHRRAAGRAECDPGERQRVDQLAGAGGDQVHRLVAHVLGRRIVEQIEAGNDRAGRADEVVAELGGEPRGQFLGRYGCGLRRRVEGGAGLTHRGRRSPDLPLWETSLVGHRRRMELDVATDIAADLAELTAEAGRLILPLWKTGLTVTAKADESPVTEADQRGEALILAGLERPLPGIPVISRSTPASSAPRTRSAPASSWSTRWTEPRRSCVATPTSRSISP